MTNTKKGKYSNIISLHTRRLPEFLIHFTLPELLVHFTKNTLFLAKPSLSLSPPPPKMKIWSELGTVSVVYKRITPHTPTPPPSPQNGNVGVCGD